MSPHDFDENDFDIDEMGPEVEGWIRHLVKNKARFDDSKMNELADSGRISEIRARAKEIIKGAVEPATERDKVMAPIIRDAIKRQRRILIKTRNALSQARVDNMKDSSAYLDRSTLAGTSS